MKAFFHHSKGAKPTDWDKECDQALIEIKQYLTEPPILASPKEGDTLYLYLVVSDVLVSATFFKEDENRKHRLVFFVRKSLTEAKTRYTRLEQAVLALCRAAKKLHPYFQAYPIIVLTNLPLRSTINKPD